MKAMTMTRTALCLLFAYFIVSCFRSEPTSITIASSDYNQLSNERLGMLLNSSAIFILMVDEVEKQPEAQRDLMIFLGIETFDELALAKGIRETYSVKKAKISDEYEVKFFTNLKIGNLLKNILQDTLESYNQALGL